MKRGGYLRRVTPMRRRKRLAPVGDKARRDREELANARVELVRRSQGRCEVAWSPLCTGQGTEAHHIVRRSQGGMNDPTNLVLTCWWCHRRIHDTPAEALVRGLLRPGWRGDAA